MKWMKFLLSMSPNEKHLYIQTILKTSFPFVSRKKVSALSINIHTGLRTREFSFYYFSRNLLFNVTVKFEIVVFKNNFSHFNPRSFIETFLLVRLISDFSRALSPASWEIPGYNPKTSAVTKMESLVLIFLIFLMKSTRVFYIRLSTLHHRFQLAI